MDSLTIVCEKKVVASDFGHKLVSGLIVLLSVYFTYQLEFPLDENFCSSIFKRNFFKFLLLGNSQHAITICSVLPHAY